jgi:hypothetical protein
MWEKMEENIIQILIRGDLILRWCLTLVKSQLRGGGKDQRAVKPN